MLVSDALRYRNAWIGIAVLYAVLFHLPSLSTKPTFTFFISNGHSSMDACLFATGIGCYLSYSRDYNDLAFMKRRFIRLLPTYWCMLFFWIIYKLSLPESISFLAVLGNILCVQHLIGIRPIFNLYIHSVWFFYFSTPVLSKLIDRISCRYCESF